MILIWFNYNDCNIYHRYVRTNYFKYYVGYKNSYGHEIIQIFLFENGKYYNIKSYDDYYFNLLKSRYKKEDKSLISFVRKLLK